jgi:hypothetical protein
MATSPNYGWLEPDNTDLVKNGALAIRTLGNAIDTTMATMTPKSIVDAKGDLIAASAADTPARLAVGNNGETLVADSSTSTGLRYQAPVQQNPVLNSAMQVWQRGTSSAIGVSSFTFFGPDRWQVYRGNTGSTVSRQVTGDTTNLPNIQYCARFQRDSGNSTTEQFYIANNFESINSIPFAGKTVTFSFYARKGANYSATSSNLVANLRSGEGTDQNYNNTYTGNTLVAGGSTTLTTTWQRFTYTGTVPTTSTELCVFFNSTPTGTAGAADYFDITGVQVEVGSVATPFKTYAATIQGELAACQRYYYRFNANGASLFPIFGLGFANTTGTCNITSQFPVTMRTKPSVIDTSAIGNFALEFSNSNIASLTSITIDNNYTNSDNGQCVVARSGVFTVGTYYRLTVSTSVAAYIGWSAEL